MKATTHNESTLALLRALTPNRRLTEPELRHVAERQANRLRQCLGISETRFPTQALELPRLHIRRDPDLPTSGATYWTGHAWLVVINGAESETRQRFSLLHEFKHVIDHPSKELLYGDNEPLSERIADYFAACALMPKPHVKRHWSQGPRTIPTMASTFGVSPAAMKYRLDQLGLARSARRCGHSATPTLRTHSPRRQHMEQIA